MSATKWERILCSMCDAALMTIGLALFVILVPIALYFRWRTQ